MPINILMPALSPTMTEGNLARWLKKEGDKVKTGDVIAEIETDKATMEVEAVDEGVMGKILVAEGTEGVKVNATIAVLLEAGEDASAMSIAPQSGNGARTPAPQATAPTPSAAPAAAPAPTPVGAAAGARVFASPLARRLAAEAGLELAGLRGTGPHGRIIKADIDAALQAPRPAALAPATAVPAAAQAPKAPTPVAAPLGAFDEIPLNNMRKTIARRLAESKQTVPHFYLSVDIELDALLALRGQINGQDGAGYKISVNDFIIKAVALALRKVPACNASFGGDKVYLYKDVDVSVAVAIDGGLITPIIRKADQKPLSVISAEMKDLAARAKAGKLKPEEFQGGGFSISNLGMFGVKEFAAIINPPQACIMAVGAGEQRPVVKSGALAIATVMTVTLSTDHRIVDGALGAEFLKEFRTLIERPLTMLV